MVAQILEPVHHDGLEKDSAKAKVAKTLDSKIVEAFILFLVIVDIGLLSIESGIDHHMLCINGRVVPNPHAASSASAVLLDTLTSWWEPHTDLEEVVQPKHALSLSDGSSPYQQDNAEKREDPRLRHWRKPGSKMQPTLVGEEPHHEHDKAITTDPHHDHNDHSSGGHEEVHGHSGHGHGHGHSEHEKLMCDTRHGHHAHEVSHNCHTASIVILVIFLVEISLKYWVDPAKFCANYFNILDLVVVTISLLVDTVVTWWVHANRPDSESELKTLMALLLFIRCWRVVRIVHGLVEHLHHQYEEEEKHEAMHEKYHNLKEEHKDLLDEHKDLQNKHQTLTQDHGKVVDAKEKHEKRIKDLEAHIDKHNIPKLSPQRSGRA